MMLSKCCTQYFSKSRRPTRGHSSGKFPIIQLSQFPRSIVLRKFKPPDNELISHGSKVMHKILHARLQHYMNQELPGIQARFRKGKGTRNQIANIRWIIKKARESQKNVKLCFNYNKAFDCVDHNKLWKTLK